MALRRFIARRGQPYEVICDQRTNFHGGESELKSAFDRVQSCKKSCGIIKSNSRPILLMLHILEERGRGKFDLSSLHFDPSWEVKLLLRRF